MARAKNAAQTQRSTSVRRPRPRMTGTPRPPELWIAIGLLAVAGCVMLYQTVPLVPEVLGFTIASSPFHALGLFYVVYLVELSLLGIVLLALAYRLYRRRPSARLTAALVCAALGVSYLLQEHRADTENSVMSLALVVAAMLALAPATRKWFSARVDRPVPVSVTAAGSIGAATGVALVMLGLGALPVTSSAEVFALLGVGLCVGGILIVRGCRGVRAGDAHARSLLSSVMVVEVVLLVMARSEAPAADAMVALMALAGAVTVLLWLPPSSRTHFSRASAGAELLRPLSSPRDAAPGESPWRPVPQPAPAPAPQEPMPSPRDVGQDEPAAPLPVSQPAPTPAPVATPPRPPPVIHKEVGIVAGSRLAKTSSLQLVYDQQSWFPEPAEDERVIGAYLVLVLLHGEGGVRNRMFEGTSSLLITQRRVAGVCPKGTGRHRPLDATRGPVIPWSVPLDELSESITATSRSGRYLTMSLARQPGTRILLAKPRIRGHDRFLPVDIAQLARDLGRARRSAAPVPT